MNDIPSDRVYIHGPKRAPFRNPGLRDCVDEAELIARARRGDRAAGRELYDSHAPAIYRLAHRMAGDPDLAEEFTQETFIRVFRNLESFRGDSALRTWIHAIAVSCVLNGMRKVKRLRDRERSLETAEEIAADPVRRLAPDLREQLARAIDTLPHMLRSMVILHDLEGYNHGEISRMTRVPEGTCKTRLARARARLRESLAAFAMSE